MSEAELFVVCKNCGAEVSPYVTECPYCGQRVRKRAPKIDRDGDPEASPRRRRRRARPRTPRLDRLRRDEIPGIAPETRPWGAAALVVAVLLVTLVLAATSDVTLFDLGGIFGPLGGGWWRVAAYAFVHGTNGFADSGYEFAALLAVALFGMHLERRFGHLAPIAIFILCAAAGGALSVGLDVYPALGANGAALGLLTAWLVDDRLAARRGDDRENDLIGVAVIAGVLLLIPLANRDASWAAGLGGAAAGAAIGALISPLRR